MNTNQQKSEKDVDVLIQYMRALSAVCKCEEEIRNAQNRLKMS